jgi:hypothetical protein
LKEVANSPLKFGRSALLDTTMKNEFIKGLQAIDQAGYSAYLHSIFNVESADAFVANSFHSTCDSCDLRDSVSKECTECGRKPNNYIRFRTGEGDGTYLVWRLASNLDARDAIGCLLILDLPTVGRQLELVLEENAGRVFDIDYSDILEPMEGTFIGSIDVEDESDDPELRHLHALYIGDVNSNLNPIGNALSIVRVYPDEYAVYIFGDRQAVLLIRRSEASKFGFNENPMASSTEITDLALGSSTDNVRAHLESQGRRCIELNCQLNFPDSQVNELDVLPASLQYWSWMLQLSLLGDQEASTALEGHKNETGMADEEWAGYREFLGTLRSISV